MKKDRAKIYELNNSAKELGNFRPHLFSMTRIDDDFERDFSFENGKFAFLFLKSGTGELKFGERVVSVKQNDCVIFADCTAKACFKSTSEICAGELLIGVNSRLVEITGAMNTNRTLTKVDISASIEKIDSAIERMKVEIAGKNRFSGDYADAIFSEIIILILQKLDYDIFIDENDPFNLAKGYIDEHYREKIKLDDLCESVFISKYYLSRNFRNRTGYTPIEYITFLRLNEAKRLLKASKLKVKEISSKVGFEDEMYFSKVFKAKVGMTPNEYRETNAKLI